MHCPLSFKGYQDVNLKLVSQQNRAWSDCTDVQTGLALYRWQRLITFDSSRIRVNVTVHWQAVISFITWHLRSKISHYLSILLNLYPTCKRIPFVTPHLSLIQLLIKPYISPHDWLLYIHTVPDNTSLILQINVS